MLLWRRLLPPLLSTTASSGPGAQCIRPCALHVIAGSKPKAAIRYRAATSTRRLVLRHPQHARHTSAPLKPAPMLTAAAASPHEQGGMVAPGLDRPRVRHSWFLEPEFLDAFPAGAAAPRRPPSPLYLVVLNYNLPSITPKLWHHATLRLCADGGCNRLYDELPAMLGASPREAAALRAAYLPDIITGDLDSLRPDVRHFYKSQGVPIHDLSEDQDSTDLTKSIRAVEQLILEARTNARHTGDAAPVARAASSERIRSSVDSTGYGSPMSRSGRGSASAPLSSGAGVSARGGSAPVEGTVDQQEGQQQEQEDHCILVLGALGGRLDHTLSNLSTLYCFSHLNIVLLGEGNIVRLVPRGRTLLHVCRGREGPACGLVPLAGPAVVSSSGLRWNVHKMEMCFRGCISTSNLLDSDTVELETSDDILWMVELQDDGAPAACAASRLQVGGMQPPAQVAARPGSPAAIQTPTQPLTEPWR